MYGRLVTIQGQIAKMWRLGPDMMPPPEYSTAVFPLKTVLATTTPVLLW